MELTEEELAEMQEEHWTRGERAALSAQLQHILIELGYSEEYKPEFYIKEREQTIAALRRICDEYGDNEWDNNLFLGDILEKHLRRHLDQDAENRKPSEVYLVISKENGAIFGCFADIGSAEEYLKHTFNVFIQRIDVKGN